VQDAVHGSVGDLHRGFVVRCVQRGEGPRGDARGEGVAQIRRQHAARRCRRSREFATLAHGAPVRLAGLVTLRQRPETAAGVTFVTLEDEDGLVNVVVWRDTAERQRRVLLESRLLLVEGRLESADGVQHLIAGRLEDYSPLLGMLDVRSRDFR
jgi:error-prone DNA polymerase